MRNTVIALAVLTLIVITVNLVRFWPDGKLHLFFCDVGQGDAIYVRFPNNQDLLIDGGPPNGKVLKCLSQHMPFYDRKIDMVMMTHPQADHMGGLADVINRYTIIYFVAPPVGNETAGFKQLVQLIKQKNIKVKNLYAGSKVRFGNALVTIDWPEKEWAISQMRNSKCKLQKEACFVEINAGTMDALTFINQKGSVLGVSTSGDLNHFSIIAELSYGTFDAIFTGDSDIFTQDLMIEKQTIAVPQNDPIEVLKVPHHGSKVGLSTKFLDLLSPSLAIIEVGAKNNYGHPAPVVLDLLKQRAVKTYRTDKDGTVEVVSDGRTWSAVKNR